MNGKLRARRASGLCLLTIFLLAVLPTPVAAERLQTFVDRWNLLRHRIEVDLNWFK